MLSGGSLRRSGFDEKQIVLFDCLIQIVPTGVGTGKPRPRVFACGVPAWRGLHAQNFCPGPGLVVVRSLRLPALNEHPRAPGRGTQFHKKPGPARLR